ncbi:Rrf2 family transcriptional regulator [Caldalkalibacillus uzonensis]|nr:Rrf2 family transcriptional regulator [Caldalkalibacillus uzonensis]
MLASAGIVESKGGREGGYILRKPADQITLGESPSYIDVIEYWFCSSNL